MDIIKKFMFALFRIFISNAELTDLLLFSSNKNFSDALIKANIIATQLVINFVIMEFSTVSTRSVISMVWALNTTITHLIQNTGMG